MINQQKTLEITDFLFAFLLISCFLGSISLGSTPFGELVPVRLILVIYVVVTLYISINKKNNKIPTTTYYFPFLFLPLFGLVSLFWTTANIKFAIAYFFNLISGCMITYIIISYAKNQLRLQRVWLLFAIGSLTQIIFACVEVITGWRVPGSIYLSSDIPDYIVLLNRYTPTGFAVNPNNLAFEIGLFFIYIFFSKMSRYIKFPIILISFLLILLTDSRAVIITIFLILVAHYIKILLSHKIINIFNKICIILCLTVIFSIIYKFSLENIFTSFFNIDDLFEKISHIDLMGSLTNILEDKTNSTSSGRRRDLIFLAFEGLIQRNFMGAGIGGSISLMESVNNYGIWVANIHNFWIELLVDFGIFPFFLLIIWYLWLFRNISKNYQKTVNNSIKKLLLCSRFLLIYIFFAGTSPSSLIYIWPFYAVLGIICSTLRVSNNTKI